MEQRLAHEVALDQVPRRIAASWCHVLIQYPIPSGKQCAAAQIGERQIGCDTKEPASRLLIAAERLEMQPGAQKHLLREVVGGILVTSHAPEIIEYLAFVLPNQALTLDCDGLSL